MATYIYRGVDKSGKEVKGTIATETIAIAKQKVKANGVMILDIDEEKSNQSKKSTTVTFGSGVPIGDLAIMTRQFATLIKAKIPIVEALAALTEQLENNNLRVMLGDIRQKVSEGMSLASAFGNYPKVFNSIYVNMVEAGEASGMLDVVLLRLADTTESQVRLKNRIKGAMTYPVVIGVFGFALMNILFIFVIPKIAKIFESMKKELPIQTKICIGISKFMVGYWWVVIIAGIIGYFVFMKYINSKGGKARWHSFQLRLPIFGIIVKMLNVSRFTSTLATLLNSGVPILTSLNIVKNLIPNVHMQEAIEKARDAVKEGASMTGPLVQSGHFPVMVTHMIKLGEKSGELEPMLKIVSETYTEQVDARINGLTSILEPIMMIVLGLAVAFIVSAVIVPMMSLNSV